MRVRVIVPAILFLFLCSAAFAGVTVTADDGAKLRIDTAKLTKLTESAIRRAAPGAALNVSIVLSAPEVLVRRPFSPTGPPRVIERLHARYTITDANGAMIESVPWIVPLEHASTLDWHFRYLRDTADYIARRVAALAKK